MIAADTSTLIAYTQGEKSDDTSILDSALQSGNVCLPPVVLSEFLSQRGLPDIAGALALQMPLLDITEGYWMRAGATRAKVLANKLRARLPDAFIAQSCIDHDVALITRDGDFRHFAEHCGLRLA